MSPTLGVFMIVHEYKINLNRGWSNTHLKLIHTCKDPGNIILHRSECLKIDRLIETKDRGKAIDIQLPSGAVLKDMKLWRFEAERETGLLPYIVPTFKIFEVDAEDVVADTKVPDTTSPTSIISKRKLRKLCLSYIKTNC